MVDRYDQDTLHAYVEGDLTPEQRIRFETQLAGDAPLRRLVTQLIDDRRAMRGLPPEEPPPGLVDDALQHLERQMLLGPADDEPLQLAPVEPHVRRYRLAKTLAYTGFAAMLLLTTGVVVWTLTGRSLLDEANRYARLAENLPARRPQPAESAVEAPPAAAAPPAVALDAGPAADAPPTIPLFGEDPVETLARSEPADPLRIDEFLSQRFADMAPSAPADASEDAQTPGAAETALAAVRTSSPEAQSGAEVGEAGHALSLSESPAEAAPPDRLEIRTSDAAATRLALTQWARSNRAQILPQAKPTAAKARLGAVEVRAFEPETPPSASQMTLRLEPTQVAELLAHLNANPRQVARLHPTPAPAPGRGASAQPQALAALLPASPPAAADSPLPELAEADPAPAQAGQPQSEALAEARPLPPRLLLEASAVQADAPSAPSEPEPDALAAARENLIDETSPPLRPATESAAAASATQPAQLSSPQPASPATPPPSASAAFDWSLTLNAQLPFLPTQPLPAPSPERWVLPVLIIEEPSDAPAETSPTTQPATQPATQPDLSPPAAPTMDAPVVP